MELDLNKFKQSRCKRCRATIYLVQTSKDTARWVPNPRRAFDWKCQPTKLIPIRPHEPETADA